MRPRALLVGIAERLAAQRRRFSGSRWSAVATGVALVALVAGAVLALGRLRAEDATFTAWPLVLLAVVGAPATLVLNALEYRVSAFALGIRADARRSARVAVYGTAANLLPIPGAVVVRMTALRHAGASTGRAVAVTSGVGVAWLGVAVLAAGGAVVPTRPGLAAGFVAVGAALLLGARTMLGRGDGKGASARVFGAVLAVEAGSVVVQALRLQLALVALGATAGPAQGFLLGSSVAIGSAVGFVPGGLGVREAVAAMLAPLVALPAEAGFLATLLDRAVGLVALLPMAAAVLVRRRGPERTGSLPAP